MARASCSPMPLSAPCPPGGAEEWSEGAAVCPRGVVRGGGGLSAGGGRRSVGPGAAVLAPGGRRSAGGSAGGRSGGRLAAAGQGGQQSGRRQGERKGAFHKSCTPFRWGPQGTGYLHFSGPSEKMQPQDKATVPPAPCGGGFTEHFPGNKEGRLSQAALRLSKKSKDFSDSLQKCRYFPIRSHSRRAAAPSSSPANTRADSSEQRFFDKLRAACLRRPSVQDLLQLEGGTLGALAAGGRAVAAAHVDALQRAAVLGGVVGASSPRCSECWNYKFSDPLFQTSSQWMEVVWTEPPAFIPPAGPSPRQIPRRGGPGE